MSPGDQQRNRRLFGGMLGWLFMSTRRPGMIGAATSFSGTTLTGPAKLERTETGWDFTSGDRQDHVTTADVLAMVGSSAFFPRTVEVVPDLADLLFAEAVHQAEVSLQKLRAADPHIQEAIHTDIETNPLPWVFATSELDRAVRASITSIVLAIAAAEAQANRWAIESGGWNAEEDRLSVTRKCQVLAERVGGSVTLGQPPYQQLGHAVKMRNAFVHSMPIPEPVPVTGARTVVPGTSISVEARATCLAVRSSFVDLARRLTVPLPKYLATCPPVAPDNDAVWTSATVMTGSREDPDFPRVVDRASDGESPTNA
jgi:hypothetical protein